MYQADLDKRDVPLFALRIFYLTQALQSSDRTYAEFKETVATEVALNASIILACVPFMKPLLDNLQPGWSTSNVERGFGYKKSFNPGGGSMSIRRKLYTLVRPVGTSQRQGEQASQNQGIDLDQVSVHRDSSTVKAVSQEGSQEAIVAA